MRHCVQAAANEKPKVPELEEFLTKRDYLGAIALLSFRRHANRNDLKNLEWLAYCYFHYGEHDKVGQGRKNMRSTACSRSPGLA